MSGADVGQREPRDQRVRDPVHGLIVFRKDSELDQLAWRLLDTPEFQRLRRIKQLGPAEFVFPSATHSRFAHCIGVFHTARQLIEIIRREIAGIGETFDPTRADVATLAALLHDLGHGPLSHAFEDVQKARNKKKKHEKWSAEIVRNEKGAIRPLLEGHLPGLSEEIATLLEAEDPKDIYHAVVSSSFDADRLDYLQRDRQMTGTQAGAIDFDWLKEHVRVRRVSIEAPDEDDPDAPQMQVPTFCLDSKALPAAEQFLLARYTLHEQVYFHKVKRCIEHMVSELLGQVARHAGKEGAAAQTGLPADHPTLTFFLNDDLESYLELDDTVLWGGIQAMTRAQDEAIRTLAKRLRDRRLYKTLDIARWGTDAGRQAQRVRAIDRKFQSEIAARTVLKDEAAKLNIYTQVGGDEERMHKKLHVLDGGRPVEISSQSDLVRTLLVSKGFTRYYFSTESDRNAAIDQRKGRL
jgi:HD superfamily phosphohydrolase